ncbi:MAG: hypothetical protein ABSF99_08720 [Anaerolineales bacterium]
MTPLHVTSIGQILAVVADATIHVHETRPLASAVLGPSPLALLGPDL